VDILIERKKVVQSKEGFFLHASWLDEVVAKIRSTGRKELNVGEFKDLTGLSRKFAIPLLELLDEMGVTRRRGATREIL
jgi:selenocysteine-specific elongation factor